MIQEIIDAIKNSRIAASIVYEKVKGALKFDWTDRDASTNKSTKIQNKRVRKGHYARRKFANFSSFSRMIQLDCPPNPQLETIGSREVEWHFKPSDEAG